MDYTADQIPVKKLSTLKVILVGFISASLLSAAFAILSAAMSSPVLRRVISWLVFSIIAPVLPLFFMFRITLFRHPGIALILYFLAMAIICSILGFIINAFSRQVKIRWLILQVIGAYLVIGFIAAWAIPYVNRNPNWKPREYLVATTRIEADSPKGILIVFTEQDATAPKIELPAESKPITPFIILNRDVIGEYPQGINQEELILIGKLALERVNHMISPAGRQNSSKAETGLRFSSDCTLARYELGLFDAWERPSTSYIIKLRKSNNEWFVISASGPLIKLDRK